MPLCLGKYEQSCTRPLKVLHKCCNTDVLGVLLIYPHSASGTVQPQDRSYISVKPLSAVLQHINVLHFAVRQNTSSCGSIKGE